MKFQMGMFVVGAPLLVTAIVAQFANMRSNVGEHFVRALPRRQKYVLYAFAFYCFATMLSVALSVDDPGSQTLPMHVGVRVFSSFWMMTYAALMAVYFSMSKMTTLLRKCKCENVCPPRDAFCGRCGAALPNDAS